MTTSKNSVTGTNTVRGGLVSAVERAARVSGRRTPTDGGVPEDVGRARDALSAWLVAGREARGLAREQVARTTRIPVRTVENLEDGRWDELPADVFVRGFLRSYARCVGLSVDEVLVRYAECGFAAAPVASAHARALLDTMSALAPVASARPTSRPVTATPVTSAPRILGTDEFAAVPVSDDSLAADAAPVAPRGTHPRAATVRPTEPVRRTAARAATVPAAMVDSAEAPRGARAQTVDGETAESKATGRKTSGRKKTVRAATVPGSRERDSRGRFIRRTGEMPVVVLSDELQAIADGFDAPAPEVAFTPIAPMVVEAAPVAVAAEATAATEPADAGEPDAGALDAGEIDAGEIGAHDVVTAAPAPTSLAPTTGSMTRVMAPRASRLIAPPSLVIDDDNPEDAETAREERAQARDGGWRSFLPPALLDQERGSRQGGLTLAVIILLIVATLTLSYLMRRPGSAGEGITALPTSVDVG